MRVSAFLLVAALSCPLLIPQQANSEEAGQNPTGYWQSVDFVQNVDDFKPGQKSWGGELSLKDIEFRSNGTTTSFVRWENDWLLHQDGKTKAQYYIKQMGDLTYLFLPWLSGDVTERGQKPHYYVLEKVSDDKKPHTISDVPEAGNRKETQGRSFQTVRPVDSIKEYDDVRWKDLGSLDLSREGRVIETLNFNEKTVWPGDGKKPTGIDPNKIMNDMKNPGLGVHKLHQQGITGKGVNVAIIDQAMYLDHPEFAGKVAAYHDLADGRKSSMHGPSVTSLLVGKNCGTAPDANVYYVAARDLVFEVDYAEGLDWIVEQNSKLPASEKIRVVSVSAAPGTTGNPSSGGQKKWNDAVSRAEKTGILVLDCTPRHNFIGPCWYNPSWPEDVERCTPGFPGMPPSISGSHVLVPASPRTTAEQYNKDEFSYQYCGRGGLSWAIPYAAGVLAMGWQVRPDLDTRQMHNLLFQSAHVTKDGAKIIDPVEFIAMVRKTPRASKKSNGLAEVSQNPIGKWQTVDFVKQIDAFIPNVKTWDGDFYLKDLEFMGGGKTSGVWMWRAGEITNPKPKMGKNGKFVIKEIDGSTYMFLEWITPDVIVKGGAKPSYYVLKRISGGDARLPRQR